MEARAKRRKRASVAVLALYACGHRVELAPRGDAETECACSRHAPLLGLLPRAA